MFQISKDVREHAVRLVAENRPDVYLPVNVQVFAKPFPIMRTIRLSAGSIVDRLHLEDEVEAFGQEREDETCELLIFS